MSAWGVTVTVIGSLLGLAGVTAAAITVAVSSHAKATIELQKDEIVAYKGRLEQLERLNSDGQERTARLQSELGVMKTIVSAAPEIEELKTYIAVRFDQMIGLLGGHRDR